MRSGPTGTAGHLGFGHEPNGCWFPWGYRHATAPSFVAAWRHIVNVFRAQGAANVTWLWTVNIIDTKGGIEPPAPWWSGNSYVNWVGIDGYYYKPSWTFAPLFGPTIKAVRAADPRSILISETAAARSDQPANRRPVRRHPRLRAARLRSGSTWTRNKLAVTSPAAVAAFRRGVRAYQRPGP